MLGRSREPHAPSGVAVLNHAPHKRALGIVVVDDHDRFPSPARAAHRRDVGARVTRPAAARDESSRLERRRARHPPGRDGSAPTEALAKVVNAPRSTGSEDDGRIVGAL
jgi:hypothetical protein